MNITVRNITEKDHYDIELVAKRAFWNLYVPGCDEHYLVHRLWNEPCYISELSLVALADEKIVGAILYSKARIETDNGNIEIDCEFGDIDDPKALQTAINNLPGVVSCGIFTEFKEKTVVVVGTESGIEIL